MGAEARTNQNIAISTLSQHHGNFRSHNHQTSQHPNFDFAPAKALISGLSLSPSAPGIRLHLRLLSPLLLRLLPITSPCPSEPPHGPSQAPSAPSRLHARILLHEAIRSHQLLALMPVCPSAASLRLPPSSRSALPPRNTPLPTLTSLESRSAGKPCLLKNRLNCG